MKRITTPLLIACLGLLFPGNICFAQYNPVPLINQPLVPTVAEPGHPDELTLTVNGTGFVPGSVVNWNGTALPTTFVGGSQLIASVPAENIAVRNTSRITVSSAPGIVSNEVFFPVTSPSSSISLSTSNIHTDVSPIAVITGDFNGDGKLDLAVLNSKCTQESGCASSGTVSILLGRGDGTFSDPVNYAVGYFPTAIAAGDFNRDGNIDLAVTHHDCSNPGDCKGKVSVLLGNGDGTFQSFVDYPIDPIPSFIVVADFNSDGKLDVVTSDLFGVVDVLLGNGDGTFQDAIRNPTGLVITSMAVADFNGDGKLDLAVSNFTSAGSPAIYTLLGNGDGSLQSPSPHFVPDIPSSLTVADFNSDGIPDIAVIGCPTGSCDHVTFHVLLGGGNGTFSLGPYSTALNHELTGLAVGDFNGDGELDIAAAGNYWTCGVTCSASSVISVFLGNGDGSFDSIIEFAVGSDAFSVVTGDFNGDGALDFATNAYLDNKVSIALQDRASH